MKFRNYGYKEENVEVREMTMGSIILTMAQGFIKNNCEDTEIRIIDCFNATIDVYKNLNELLIRDCCADWKVKVYDWGMMQDNTTNRNYFKLIISDSIEI